MGHQVGLSKETRSANLIRSVIDSASLLHSFTSNSRRQSYTSAMPAQNQRRWPSIEPAMTYVSQKQSPQGMENALVPVWRTNKSGPDLVIKSNKPESIRTNQLLNYWTSDPTCHGSFSLVAWHIWQTDWKGFFIRVAILMCFDVLFPFNFTLFAPPQIGSDNTQNMGLYGAYKLVIMQL